MQNRVLASWLQHRTLFLMHSNKEARVAPFQGLTSTVTALQQSPVHTGHVEAGTMSFHIISISPESRLATEVHPRSRARVRKVLHWKYLDEQKSRWWVGLGPKSRGMPWDVLAKPSWDRGAGISADGLQWKEGCWTTGRMLCTALPTPSRPLFLGEHRGRQKKNLAAARHLGQVLIFNYAT